MGHHLLLTYVDRRTMPVDFGASAGSGSNTNTNFSSEQRESYEREVRGPALLGAQAKDADNLDDARRIAKIVDDGILKRVAKIGEPWITAFDVAGGQTHIGDGEKGGGGV